MSLIEYRAEELPSRGLTYPEGTVFSLKGFDYGEIKDLNTTVLTLETKLKRFCEAVTLNTELQKSNICYIDYIYAHLGRVASTYGNDKLQFPIICPHCENSVTHTVLFSELELNDVSEYADIMPLTIEIAGKEYSFNFLTLDKVIKWYRLNNDINLLETITAIKEEHDKLEQEVNKITPDNPNEVIQAKWEEIHKQYTDLNGRMGNKRRMKAMKYKVYGNHALLLAFMCSDIGEEDFDTFLNTVNKAEGETIEFLQFVEEVLGTGIKPVKITCPHCSKIFMASVEEVINDVYPFRTSPKDIADRLRAKQKTAHTSESTEE